MSSELPSFANDQRSLQLETKEVVKAVFNEYWSIILAVIGVFSVVFYTLFAFQGRISALEAARVCDEAKFQMYIELQKNNHQRGD
jgi:hypothetical protein